MKKYLVKLQMLVFHIDLLLHDFHRLYHTLDPMQSPYNSNNQATW